MRILFNGRPHVHYRQIYVASGLNLDLTDACAGQSNGLCGAAVPGSLFLTTGLHTGHIAFTVELHEKPPPLDESWQEIVEVSFRPVEPDVALVQWAGEAAWPLDLELTNYRVRYCATGMDQAREADTILDDGPPLDRYLLQFWPSPPAPDQVVKQTSDSAAYWHDIARKTTPPPTPEEKAEAKRREQLALKQAKDDREAERWGGRPPSERLRTLGGNVWGMAKLDRDLVDAVEAISPDRQRMLARWAARRACTEAGLVVLDSVERALAAADRQEPLPAPFDDERQAWEWLLRDDQVPHTTVAQVPLDANGFDAPPAPRMLQQAMALPALFAAVDTDPLRGALDALFAMAHTFGPAYRAVFAEARDLLA
ncbi:hypothetical protein MOQ72_39425 [Saccharopolyspora sp. K220]|uniref:hypothetical protein n=1 Tax=Saccharopolyspora soli TaxID=2926618 RepID=UPI001F5A0E94|nr:hypothetical protein [Saccharopolyspora soli]MCI2423497.1 hypothetical protein [Saccharopolyspora soli]